MTYHVLGHPAQAAQNRTDRYQKLAQKLEKLFAKFE